MGTHGSKCPPASGVRKIENEGVDSGVVHVIGPQFKIMRCLTILVYFLVLVSISLALEEDEIEYEDGPAHIIMPRSIRFFSKGPDPGDPRYEGPRISKHLHNVIQGGTVGVQFNVKEGMGRFGPFWDKIRRYLPKYRGGKRPDFIPDDDSDKDAELLDPVGRGLINPRIKPSAKEEMEWERV
ncbi:hypothetical protein AVEN_180004-1 [Araneus ventricosus]|uniref:Uncharacterized protein n=1 Tax=Araneus ventricosus TaxID=182803 RepID=A0A4Y2U3Q3_ARAVE|nr:hypothetical protein AVEN_194169-1 [Araneus ventricosus]GBO06290.1 hypothetical protein AVEN_126785-1 [Araneus ventricosus]GBO06323.1 hypothetical protein AVEN_264293-1 [Araneus ventricosus]GBO06335.1 hypothetical protein AVEN_180004-1 [Araneus ventricosus]